MPKESKKVKITFRTLLRGRKKACPELWNCAIGETVKLEKKKASYQKIKNWRYYISHHKNFGYKFELAESEKQWFLKRVS